MIWIAMVVVGALCLVLGIGIGAGIPNPILNHDRDGEI